MVSLRGSFVFNKHIWKAQAYLDRNYSRAIVLPRPSVRIMQMTATNVHRLACTAFTEVFHRRQTKHAFLLAWLRIQLASPASRREEGVLAATVG
jgi:hypothetical protein